MVTWQEKQFCLAKDMFRESNNYPSEIFVRPFCVFPLPFIHPVLLEAPSPPGGIRLTDAVLGSEMKTIKF